MKKERENNTKYKRLSIQKKASKEVDREICRTLCDRRSNIKECSKVEVAIFDEDSSSGECQQNSEIQRTSKGAESGKTKTSRSGKSRGIES